MSDTLTTQPKWIRAPKSGTEHWTGLNRSKLYELAGKGLIKSISLREPGQKRGTRLFHLESIFDLYERMEANAQVEAGAK
jgi:hypothetical protein